MADFEFRRLTAADIPMIREWLTRPHAADAPDRHPSPQDSGSRRINRGTDPLSSSPFLALRSGRPVGFIQAYIPARCGGGWWPDEQDPGVVGIEEFLPDQDDFARPLGPAMIRAFVAELLQDPAVMRIQTDPRPADARAIRCYARAGFVVVGEIGTPAGEALLMVCDRD